MKRVLPFAPIILLAACGGQMLVLDDSDDVLADGNVEDALTSGLSLAPEADAYVRNGSLASTNFGADPVLRIDRNSATDTLVSYLRFKVGAVSGTITKAHLRCYATNGTATSVAVSKAGNGWSESTLTYNNQPALIGAVVAKSAAVPVSTWFDVDVTSAVAANSTVTFALIPSSADGLTCNSKEAASGRPSLVLTIESLPVTVASPAANATLKGSVVFAALVGGTAQTSDGRIDFLIDGKSYGPAVLGLGWNYVVDTTRLTNGSHAVVARRTDLQGAVSLSPSLSFKVDNAPAEIWGDHLGIVVWAGRANFDKARALGVRWVRISHELGWGSFDDSLITYAHSIGLKVLHACQKSANGQHIYTDADIPAFASYCAAWVDKGVDAIEIGNEWNHRPFYLYNGGDPDSTFVSQAKYFDATTAAIRAKSATIPIINSGWSPEPSPRQPQEAMAKTLDNSTTFKARGTGVGHHPYAYNCQSILQCSYPARRDWNSFLATQDVYAAAKARGFDHGVWMTEIGAPTGGGNRNSDGVPYSNEMQRQVYADIFTGIPQMRAAGTKIDVVFFYTLNDGPNASDREDNMGIYDRSGVLKPAGQLLRDQVSKPW